MVRTRVPKTSPTQLELLSFATYCRHGDITKAAYELGLSEATFKHRIYSLYDKFDAASSLECALSLGWLKIPAVPGGPQVRGYFREIENPDGSTHTIWVKPFVRTGSRLLNHHAEPDGEKWVCKHCPRELRKNAKGVWHHAGAIRENRYTGKYSSRKKRTPKLRLIQTGPLLRLVEKEVDAS